VDQENRSRFLVRQQRMQAVAEVADGASMAPVPEQTMVVPAAVAQAQLDAGILQREHCRTLVVAVVVLQLVVKAMVVAVDLALSLSDIQRRQRQRIRSCRSFPVPTKLVKH
jgi:hypothetical protein